MLLKQDCQGDDYERWSPPSPEICLLGKNYTYERRKRDSQCFNGKTYSRADVKESPCLCDKVCEKAANNFILHSPSSDSATYASNVLGGRWRLMECEEW